MKSEMTADNRRNAEDRLSVISDYGQFLEQNAVAGEIRDASELPYPKEEILDAICVQLALENDDDRREALKVGAYCLADFQAGVGTEPLSPFGISAEEMAHPSKSHDELRAMAARMANNPNQEKYETFKAKVETETAVIQAKLAAAEELRQQIPNTPTDAPGSDLSTNGTPINDLTFNELQSARHQISGWMYPKRNISPFIPMFSRGQRTALNFYAWIAMLMVLAGMALPIALGSWWWLLLIPGGAAVWRANRQSMEQFFIENLGESPEFYEIVRNQIGEQVRVVLQEE